MSFSVYSFADASGLIKYVDSNGDFNLTGAWSNSTAYTASPLTAVSYGPALYMCIQDSTGENPVTTPASWAIMALLYEYQDSGSIAPDPLALDAYRLAESGTNIGWAAYALAQIGTNTGTAAYDLAAAAYALAASGTAAQTALSTADAAYALAQIGTNTGTAALDLASTGSNLAWAAWELAQTGTNDTTFATPTGLVGLTAYAGTGTDAMRSDATPALDQDISPLWGGRHVYKFGIFVGTNSADWGDPPITTETYVGYANPSRGDNDTVDAYLQVDSDGSGVNYSEVGDIVTSASTRRSGLTVADTRSAGWHYTTGTYPSGFTGSNLPYVVLEFTNSVGVGPQTLVQIDPIGYFGYGYAHLFDTAEETINTVSDIVRFQHTGTQSVAFDTLGNAEFGHAVTDTAATDGFVYLPATGGPPVGIPTAKPGKVPIVVDSAGTTIWAYITDTWHAFEATVAFPATADEAYALAQIGTNTGTAAYDLALAAYALAQTGTNAVITEQGTRAEADQVLQNEIDSITTVTAPATGNYLISGGNAVWVSGYTFDVSAAQVSFSGSTYSFAGATFTLQAADPTDDRIDLLVADQTTQTLIVVAGTPSNPPAPPEYDPSSQFQLSFIPVDANTVQPPTVATEWIYRENVEWTTAVSNPSINPNSTVTPYQGTKCIQATAATNGQYITLTSSVAFDLATYDTLFLYIKPSSWSGNRSLSLNFETSGGVRKGGYVVIANNSFGFKTNNASYQLVALPTNLFAVPSGQQVQRLRITVTASGGSMSWFIDDIGLQYGVAQPQTQVPDATTTIKGIVRLAINGETAAGAVVQGNDYRLVLGQIGTNTGSTAYSTANSAYLLAQIGTNTGTAAYTLATTGSNLAWQAYVRATSAPGISTLTWGGTVTIDFTGSAYQKVTLNGSTFFTGANYSPGVAVAVEVTGGTVASGMTFNSSWRQISSFATSLSSGAVGFISLLSTGSTAALVDAGYAASDYIRENTTALAAYFLAQVGTNTGSTAYSVAQTAYSIAQIGTNTGSTAYSTAQTGYSIAQIGTNTGTAAYNLALAGSNTAWMAHKEAGTKVDTSGGTMTGNLITTNVQTSVGTHPLVGTSGGTNFYSFYGPAYQRTTVDRNFYVNVLDMAAGREIAIVLEATGTPYTIGWPGQINFFGTTAPTNIAVNHITVAMTSLSTTISSIIAATITSSGSGAIG